MLILFSFLDEVSSFNSFLWLCQLGTIFSGEQRWLRFYFQWLLFSYMLCAVLSWKKRRLWLACFFIFFCLYFLFSWSDLVFEVWLLQQFIIFILFFHLLLFNLNIFLMKRHLPFILFCILFNKSIIYLLFYHCKLILNHCLFIDRLNILML